MTETVKPLLDSNIFLYAANRDSLFHKEAMGVIETYIRSGFYLTDLNLIEFYQVVTDGRKTKNPFEPAVALDYILKLIQVSNIQVIQASSFGNIICDSRSVKDISRYAVKRYQIYDYLIAECMRNHHITTIITANDRDFRKFDFLEVINPFKTKHASISGNQYTTIPYGRQSINEMDVAAVCNVLRSGYITQGPTIPAFEAAVANYCGAQYAVAVSSGTAALHLACLALDVGPGDVVWTSPITFVASANCARYCGADVDFVDIDPHTWNLSPERLEKKLIGAKAAGRLPKVVIPVHFAGQSCDMIAIQALSKEYGFRIIEDACHALGGQYKGEPIGNCRYSDIAVFSFHPVKSITTAEGGMAVTNDRFLADRMARLRTHGITRQPDEMNKTPDGPWYYQQIELGFNYRMTDVQAALGTSQMKRLDEFIANRRGISDRYDRMLADLPVNTPRRHPDTKSSYHLYVIRLKLDQIQKTHKEVFDALRASDIGVNLHYIPVYLQPDFEKLGFEPGYCTEAEQYYDEAISLPIFPDLTEAQQDRVITMFARVLLS